MNRSEIARLGGLSHKKKDPNYFRKLGQRGGVATSERLQDEDFREEFSDRVRDGMELQESERMRAQMREKFGVTNRDD